MRQIKSISIFRRGVYLAENTSQAASVEFVRLWRTNYARSRLQKLAEKPEGVFRQAQAGRPETSRFALVVPICSEGHGSPQYPSVRTLVMV